MKIIRLFITLLISMIFLSACADRELIMWHDDDTPVYAKKGGKSTGKVASRQPLEVPPELRAELSLPGAEKIASNVDKKVLPKKYQAAVAGKAVSLDARMYKLTPAEVFSAVVDAMTSLNIPVQSVDSPSGIITSDWIRRGEHTMSIFGGGADSLTRHRFIVRVYRAKTEDRLMTRLEIRTLGQAFHSRRWMNRPIKRKIAEELFSAAEEQLTRMKATALPLESTN